MTYQKLLENLTVSIDALTASLKENQLNDGGFKGYHLFDKTSGIWSTCEILYLLIKTDPSIKDDEWVTNAVAYIVNNQNKDGGWGFRANGKSIIDVTAWACLSLMKFECEEQILKGIAFIIKARKNTIAEYEKGGWGLTTYEPDRIYSTWVASHCLKCILRERKEWLSEKEQEEIYTVLNEANAWVIQAKSKNNAWAPLGDDNATCTSSAIALISLFSNGEDPSNYKDSFAYLASQEVNGLWHLEREIVITQEGYELTQEWFTSIYCFQAYIYFAEFGVCSYEKLYSTYLGLLTLISDGKVKPAHQTSLDLIWTIPFMIESLDKFRSFILSNKKEVEIFLYKKSKEEKKKKKDEIELLLKNYFPYPISQVYFSYSHEIDYHRRFQYLVQMYEVLLKYTSIVCLSTSLASGEKIDKLESIVTNRFKRPSLGDFASIIEIILNYSGKIQNVVYPYLKEDILKRQINFIDAEMPRVNFNQTLSEIVALRNNWAGHGAIRSIYEYKEEIEKQTPILFSLLNRLLFLAKCNSFLILSSEYNEFGDGDLYKIRIFNGLDISDIDLELQKRLSEGQREKLIRYVYFHNTESNTIINLYPFLSHMFCSECKKERFFFYNGVKSTKLIAYLSFECGHTMEYDNYSHFEKRFSSIGIDFKHDG